MKSIFFLIPLLLFYTRCRMEHKSPRNINKVVISHLLEDSSLNIRALEVDSYRGLRFATSEGELGENYFNDSGEKAKINIQIKEDTITPNFRALAITNKSWFVLSIASPALLYKVKKDSARLVYQENDPKAFYDSMNFWNADEGIAVGDSIDGCLSIIITRDGGETWNKLLCDSLFKVAESEGAFAASDTNIAIVGDKTWVATNSGRIYFSEDKGKTWKVIDTPIIKEKETEGIYSIDFYDELNGFAIGGDYTNSNANAANKIKTTDGGKTWGLVAQNESPGYRSCVQYIPNRQGKELIAIGFKGIDFSNDSGETWRHLSDEGFYTIRFLNDSTAYAAGEGRVSKLVFKE